jgi:hypothetical protein
MTDDIQNFATPAIPPPPVLTPVERVLYTFTAPSKTFNDIKRSTSWWLPFVLTIIFSYGFFAAINAKVGWNQVAENNIKQSPKAVEQMDKLAPEQRAQQMKISAMVTEGIMAAVPIFSLLVEAVVAGVLLATINFGFGGKASYWQVFAVCWFGGLPGLLKLLLATIALFAGLDAESFNLNNPAGTNIGYYLGPETAKPLMALATAIDPITIWSMALTAIGLSIVAGTKRSAGYTAVFGWWALLTIIGIGWTAAFS